MTSNKTTPVNVQATTKNQQHPHAHSGIDCLASIGTTAAELSEEKIGKRALFSQLPDQGPGFSCYGSAEKRYGRPEVVRAIAYVCDKWNQQFPNYPRVGVGNMSYQGGGPIAPHTSHQKGVDVDLSPVASTHEEVALTWQSPNYSKKRTQQLVDLILNNPHLQVRTILFNDPNVTGVQPYVGHDNHLHVSFYPSAITASEFSSDQTGTLALVEPYMEGKAVKALQQNLQSIGIKTRTDGVFGPMTDAAVRQFQANYGLDVDGVVGNATRMKLTQAKEEGLQPSSSKPKSGLLPKWKGGDKQAAIKAIRQEARRQGISVSSQVAYILATVEHETAGSFQPVRESYYLGEPGAENHRKTLRYYPYYGRGYVQLTWDYNYRAYSTTLGLDLVNQPDLVMRPDVALFILVDGMKRGVFTGISLEDCTNGSGFDFVEARRIINGKDKAVEIANIASGWLSDIA